MRIGALPTPVSPSPASGYRNWWTPPPSSAPGSGMPAAGTARTTLPDGWRRRGCCRSLCTAPGRVGGSADGPPGPVPAATGSTAPSAPPVAACPSGVHGVNVAGPGLAAPASLPPVTGDVRPLRTTIPSVVQTAAVVLVASRPWTIVGLAASLIMPTLPALGPPGVSRPAGEPTQVSDYFPCKLSGPV